MYKGRRRKNRNARQGNLKENDDNGDDKKRRQYPGWFLVENRIHASNQRASFIGKRHEEERPFDQDDDDEHNCIMYFKCKKMAIILPTGQWYAPSAVINDAWYYIVLHVIA